MTDIVERLKPLQQWFGEAKDAADEIERLRRLLRVALDARFEDEAPSDGWYESVRKALGIQ